MAESKVKGPAAASSEEQPNDRGFGKWWVLLAVGTGTFMSALDGSVVNTILPVLHGAFRSSVATIEWVVTVYLLVISSLLLGFGRLGDIRGHKPTYLSGFVLFIMGSALCGLSPGASALIGARGLQAVGAAMLFSNSPAILTMNFPAEQRGQALGMLGTMTYLGLTAGPSLGGWLAGRFGWQSVFFINVPVGLLALFLSFRFVPRDEVAGKKVPFDITGAAAFTVGLVALLLALNRGHAWGWSSPLVLGLLVGSGVVLAVFISIERRLEHPMLDLGLFCSRLFSAAAVSALLNYLCATGALFLLPFYLIQGRGLHPQQAGLLLTAQPLTMAILAPITGALSDRIGSRIPGTLGMGILAVGLFFLSRSGAHTPLSHLAIGLAIVGLGSGIFISPNNNALMGSAPRHRQGIAGGILAICRNVGMVLGVGVIGAVYTSITAHAGPGSTAGLFRGVQVGLMTAAGVALLGMVTSAVRGDE